MIKEETKSYLFKEIAKILLDHKPDMAGRILCTMDSDYDMISIKSSDEDPIGYRLTFYVRETGVTYSSQIGPDENPTDKRKSQKIYQFSESDTKTDLKKSAVAAAEEAIHQTRTIYEAELVKKKKR